MVKSFAGFTDANKLAKAWHTHRWCRAAARASEEFDGSFTMKGLQKKLDCSYVAAGRVVQKLIERGCATRDGYGAYKKTKDGRRSRGSHIYSLTERGVRVAKGEEDP